ncbi:MAG: alpha/beta fold hydrolase [Hyphomonadaceae bacterium]
MAQTPTTLIVGDAQVRVRTVGEGAPVLMIASLGRDVSDFDQLAEDLAAQGFMAILPSPRGGADELASRGPAAQTIADLADDAAGVIDQLCDGPAHVVGHAFGQRVTRMLAARHPGRVRSVVLLAAGGRAAMPENVRQDLIMSVSVNSFPMPDHRAAIARAFFAQGQDASVWHDGWFPLTAQMQVQAVQRTPLSDWWAGGSAPMLVVQAAEDPIAPAANGEALLAEFPDRVRLVSLAHASHAILPEQPAAVAAVVAAFLSGERDQAALQRLIDRNVRIPQQAEAG